MTVLVEGPITSSTIFPKFTDDDASVSGSTNRLASPGGGHTASWKMEPDSEARKPRRCGDGALRDWMLGVGVFTMRIGSNIGPRAGEFACEDECSDAG